MPRRVARVAVPIVSSSEARSSASLPSSLTPVAPPLPTSPTSGAARKRRKSDAESATTTLSAASMRRVRGARHSARRTSAGWGGCADKAGDLGRNVGTHRDRHTQYVDVCFAQDALPLLGKDEGHESCGFGAANSDPGHGDAVENPVREVVWKYDELKAVLPRNRLIVQDVIHLARLEERRQLRCVRTHVSQRRTRDQAIGKTGLLEIRLGSAQHR